MKFIRLTRGAADIFDVRGYPSFSGKADATMTLPSGRVVPKYVFHALDSAGKVDPELRGLAVEVTDKEAEELLTLPFVTFEEVTPAQEVHDRYLRTLVRTGLGGWLDPATNLPVDRAALVKNGPPKEEPPLTQGLDQTPATKAGKAAAAITPE